MSNLKKYGDETFESIRHIDENGTEYWSARELQNVLEYTQWRNFVAVIQKAQETCLTLNIPISDHFADVSKMIPIAKGANREIEDILLTRYACYLVVMNGDPTKPSIAAGKNYFAVQTRKQELNEQIEQLEEDQKRLAIRKELIEHNKNLADAASEAGIVSPQDYGCFQNFGYRGLYGGLDAQDIHERKGLKKSQKILDHMGSEELAANLFRATQTASKLRRDGIVGKSEANKTHYEVGKKVRETIAELGGTMPENLPVPEKSIKQIEREQKKLESDE
jgi:DNA-damage-inducible protein D